MRTAYILSGVPGCGKSTWAKNFIKTHPNTKIIASDDIRYEIGGAYQYFKEEQRVWNLFFSRANELAKNNENIDVILDSTCLTNIKRKDYLRRINGFDHLVLVYFNVDRDVCLKRNKMHIEGKVVKDEPMDNMLKSVEYPNKDVLASFDDFLEIKN